MRVLPIVALALALALGAGCRSTPLPERSPDGARERALLERILADLSRSGGAAGLDTDVLERQAERFDQLVAWEAAGELETAAQRFWGGAGLVRSDEPEHLVLAESLGASAAVLGEPRGRLVEAEARDRMALLVGEPQPFGTQSVFDPLMGEWRLYAVDPRTTDDERAAMGLPTLEELRARAAERNDSPLTRRLRDELVRPTGLVRTSDR